MWPPHAGWPSPHLPGSQTRREAGRAASPAPRRGRAGARAGGGIRGGRGAAAKARGAAARVRHAGGGHGGLRPTRRPGAGRPGPGGAVALAPAAASGAAGHRPGVASEQPPAPFIPAAPPPFPGSRGASEVSVLSVPGAGRGLRPKLLRPAPGPAPPRAPASRPRGQRRGPPCGLRRGTGPRRPGVPRGVWRAPRCVGLRVGATILCEGMSPSPSSLPSLASGRVAFPATASPPGAVLLALIARLGETWTRSGVELKRLGSGYPT